MPFNRSGRPRGRVIRLNNAPRLNAAVSLALLLMIFITLLGCRGGTQNADTAPTVSTAPGTTQTSGHVASTTSGRDEPSSTSSVTQTTTLATPTSTSVPIFAAEGQVVLRGSWGSSPGRFGMTPPHESAGRQPTSLRVSSDGHLWILDPVNARIQVFFPDGDLEWIIPLPLGPHDDPQDFAVSEDGTIVLDNTLTARMIQAHDRNGKLLAQQQGAWDSMAPGGLLVDETTVYAWYGLGAFVPVFHDSHLFDPKTVLESMTGGRQPLSGGLTAEFASGAEEGVVRVFRGQEALFTAVLSPSPTYGMEAQATTRGNVILSESVLTKTATSQEQMARFAWVLNEAATIVHEYRLPFETRTVAGAGNAHLCRVTASGAVYQMNSDVNGLWVTRYQLE
jgi:hypothetical protein